MKNISGKLDFAIQVLLTTNIWIVLYTKLLSYLNTAFSAPTQREFLWVPSVPEPFEIPLYLGLSLSFILLIFFSQKLFSKLNTLPLKLKIFLLLLLSLLFLSTLGKYPMGGEYDPYPPRSNGLIYLIVGFTYLLVIGLLTFLSRYLKPSVLYLLVFIVIVLITFDAGFPMAGHDYEYFIGPSYEVAQGKTVYTDILSRYAFITVDLFAFLHKSNILSLYYIPLIIWILYIAQYFLCFFLLKKISDSNILASLGTFSIMTMNYFSLSHLPSVIPQIGPLRWFPIVFLLFLFYKFKNFESKKFIFTIALLSFFMIDVGIAILMAYGASLFILFLVNKTIVVRIIKAILLLSINLIVILLAINILHLALGYKPVDILTPFYSFKKHAVLGLSMIPIKEKNYFWLVLLIYFASIIYFFRQNSLRKVKIPFLSSSWEVRSREKRDEHAQLSEKNGIELSVLLFSANLSLFASVYFVGRSHPHNLFNISLFPLLNLFILIGLFSKKLQSANRRINHKHLALIILFVVFIVFPTYQRRFTLTEMLITKYSRLTAGKIFKSEVEKIISAKYKDDIKLIKNNFPNKAVIFSVDDTYLFYSSGKKNLLDANPILGIDLPEDINFAVKNAVKKCPQKIAIDCSFAGKCQSYTSFVGVTFNLKLLLDKLESGCKSKYVPNKCSPHLCIADRQKI